MKWRFEIEVETGAELIPCDIVPGNYPDPHWVDRMFRTAIARYEADEAGRMLSFKIKRVQDLQ